MMFNQPDTLIPDPYNPLDWNRYSYARYNPVKYTDPTGHAVSDGGPVGCGFACDPTRSAGLRARPNYGSRIDLGEIQVRLKPGNPEDDYTGFSGSGETYEDPGDLGLPRRSPVMPKQVVPINGVDVGNDALSWVYYNIDGFWNASGVYGSVYVEVTQQGLVITAVGIQNNHTWMTSQISGVEVTSNNRTSFLYSNPYNNKGELYGGIAPPGVTTVIPVNSDPIPAGQTFDVTIRISSIQPITFSGSMTRTITFNPYNYCPNP